MDKIYDLIIIGAGPAGLTAALFASRYGLKFLIIEKLSPGGQIALTDKIENYPGIFEEISGRDLAYKFKAHAEKFNLNMKFGEIVEIEKNKTGFKLKTKQESFETYTVIAALGAQPRRLDIPGEKEFTGKGVSYCATCDGPFFKDKKVVVIGGGNTAVEEALYLSKIAQNVKLVHRRDSLRAVEFYAKQAELKENIQMVMNSVPVEIKGAETVNILEIENIKTKQKSAVNCDGIFIFAGYKPNSGIFKNLLQLDEKEYIITDSGMMSSEKGFYAAGDIRQKTLRQVITACSDGAVACDSAYRYVSKMKGSFYGE